MIFFTSFEYFAFLASVVAVYWMLKTRQQNVFLLLASYVFYSTWDWRFLSLLIFSSVLGYYSGRGMFESNDPRRRKLLLFSSLVGNLAVLGFFKYYNFFIENLTGLLSIFKIHLPSLYLEILLPLGISYYTFQVLSYSFDVYRGNIEPTKSLLSFAVFTAYFPHLLAGPIQRASKLLSQIDRDRRFSLSQFMSGIDLIVWGLLKKLVIADNVGLYVNMIFSLSNPSLGMLVLGGFGFLIQLYCDFSAYTDLARGSSRLLGIELSINFDRTYLARNPSDFWKRWHISLSSWVYDYVFMPAVFFLNRLNINYRISYVVSAFIAFGLLGLWHGASWHFVLSGVYSAVLITIHQLVIKPIIDPVWRENRLTHLISVISTYFFMNFGLILFRVESTSELMGWIDMTHLMMTAADLNVIYILSAIFVYYSIPLIISFIFWECLGGDKWDIDRLYGVRILYYSIALVTLVIFSGTNPNEFIYFQF